MPFHLMFVIAALVVFILAALNVPSSRVNLVALGLALLTASELAAKTLTAVAGS